MKEIELFQTVRKSKKISESTDTDILEHLTIVMLKLGIRAKNLPEEQEKKVLIDHIRKKFGYMNILSIRLAFEHLIDGVISGPEHFENFSCAYFSKVMNAYKSWENKVFRELPPEPLPELPPIKMSDDELIKMGVEMWNNTRNLNFIPQRLYEVLKCNPNEDEQMEAAKRVTSIINAKLLENRYMFNVLSREVYFDRLMRAYFIVKKLEGMDSGKKQ